VCTTVVIASGILLGVLSTAAGAGAVSAQAKKHLLVLSDMPKGWSTEKGTNNNSGSNNFPGAKQLAGCIGVPVSLITSNPPQANSPYFENKSGSLEVQDTVSVFPSAKNAQAQYRAIDNAKTPSCVASIMNTGTYKSQIAAAAGEGTEIGTITVTEASPANFASNTAGFTLNIPFTSQGVNVTAMITAVYFVKGKLGQQITFNSYGTTFPASISKHVTSEAQGLL
jgi:hypothetical protein